MQELIGVDIRPHDHDQTAFVRSSRVEAVAAGALTRGGQPRFSLQNLLTQPEHEAARGEIVVIAA